MTFTSVTSSGLHRWAATTALGITVILGGCSDGSATSAGSSADSPTFNEADVKFAQTMIRHHEQSIEMADMILGKTGVSSEVTQPAQAISDTQRPQMETLSGSWLRGTSLCSRTMRARPMRTIGPPKAR